MAELILILIQEHRNIIITLDKLKNLEPSSQESKDLLVISKNLLLTHLRKEDDILYPALNKIALEDHKLKIKLDIYAYDMKDISLQTLGFFNKYIGSDNFSQFNDDLNDLYEKQYLRIKKEEEVIYPHYNKTSLK